MRLNRPSRFLLAAVGVIASNCLATLAIANEDAISFSRDIRPLLSDHCFSCHGPDEEQRQADLRLDLAEAAAASEVVVPGKPAESTLWQRIVSSDPDSVMPPPDAHNPLSSEQQQLIRKWIESGAQFSQHWSFVAPRQVSVPESKYSNPIDAFLEKRQRQQGLAFQPEADRRTLIRRVTLDLTGLPPTREEILEFLNDDREDAYERLINRLMKRPSYGEHMARYWLDLARYADTHGLHLDNERSMWPYRDWVVRAFRENLPFDEFTRWQLAGDLLDNPTDDQLIASGFNRCNVSTSEGGSINEEWVYRYAVDRTTTTAEVWMGLTAGCAVCHDHKFDPISSVDYYSLYAFFHSAADPAMDGNRKDTPPVLKLLGEKENGQLEQIDDQIAAANRKLTDALKAMKYVDPASQQPPPSPRIVEQIWFADDFPTGAEVQHSDANWKLVDAEKETYAGERALRRSSPEFGQDFFNKGSQPLTVTAKGVVFAYCYLDANDPPETIMLQFHTNGWKHRAVWGAEEKIGFGKAGTSEKVLMGPLPELGKWIRLEVPASKMGLKPSSKITGYAFTQFGGTVTWDQLGIRSKIDPGKDTAWSFQAWKQRWAGKRNNDLPEGIRQLVRGKPASKWSSSEEQQILDLWLRKFYAGTSDEIQQLKTRLDKLAAKKQTVEAGAPVTMVMAELKKPRKSFVMMRGAYDQPGEQVQRNVPGFLPPLPAVEGRDYNRLDLANWLVSDQHPLTARVAVNRIWQQFFGTGIVGTSSDFGSQGAQPSHPELLDWLAIYFREHDWNVQQVVRLILTSRAYQQSAQVTPELLAQDPDNRWLARAARLRLDAEVLRDQALFVSGLLVDRPGGRGVNPYQPPNIWEPVGFGNSNTRYYKQGSGDDLYRRSIYTFLKRTAPPPFMSTFDAPNREQSCTRRARTNTPMQALQLMNDIQHVEAARNLGQRMLIEGGETPAERIGWGWEVVTGRPPMPTEEKIAASTLSRFLARYEKDPQAASQLVHYGESQPDKSLPEPQLAAYTMLANLLLNLDETINRN